MFTSENQKGYFINMFMKNFFTNLPPDYIKQWESNINATATIANMVATVAVRNGVSNPDLIIKKICLLLLPNDPEKLALQSTDIIGNPFHSAQMQAAEYAKRVAPLQHALQICNADALLKHFFLEHDALTLSEMADTCREVASRSDYHEFLNDIIAITRLLRQDGMMNERIKQLQDDFQKFCTTYHFTLPDNNAKDRLPRFLNLASFMSKWAEANHFSPDSKFAKVMNNKVLTTFAKDNTFFKDANNNVITWPVAWRHALIWYCIVEQQKKSPFLMHDATQVYDKFCNYNLKAASALSWDLILEKTCAPAAPLPTAIANTTLAAASMQRKW